MTESERIVYLEKKVEELERRLKAIEIALAWGLYSNEYRRDDKR